MRVLVTGASSEPGAKFVSAALKKGFEVFGLYFSNPIPVEGEGLHKIRLDLTDFGATSRVFEDVSPDVVFHFAALGNVDECERDRLRAWRTNYLATLHLAKLAGRHGIPFVYLSTDYVFDGERGFYREDDVPNPVNFYGLTKLLGEVAVQNVLDRFAIVRASAIYGLSAGRKNFAKFLIERLSRGEEVRALVDQYLSPTNSSLLAEALLYVLENDLRGVFHVVGERMSRFEFAVRVADKFGFDKSLIREARMSDFNWFARRPRDSSLSFEKTRDVIKVDFYSTDRALDILWREYLERGGKV